MQSNVRFFSEVSFIFKLIYYLSLFFTTYKKYTSAIKSDSFKAFYES